MPERARGEVRRTRAARSISRLLADVGYDRQNAIYGRTDQPHELQLPHSITAIFNALLAIAPHPDTAERQSLRS